MIRNTYYLLYAGLLFACAFPRMNMFYDSWNTPKWLCTLLVLGLLATYNAIYHTLRKEKKSFDHFKMWSKAFIAVATLECFYALIQLYKYPAMWELGISGTFDNPAGLAFFLCVSLPFPFALSDSHKTDKATKAVYLAVDLLMTICILLTHSRTGMLCLTVYVLSILIYYGLPPISSHQRFILPVIAVAICAALSLKTDSTSGRMFILTRTWELIRENPWTGYGTGGFSRKYMNRQADFFQQHPDAPAAMLADETSHPLNEFAFLWVEHGLAAPLALILLLAGVWYVLRKRKDIPYITASYMLAPLLLFSLFSYPFRYPMAWIVAGWCMGMAGEKWIKKLFYHKHLKPLAVLYLVSFGTGSGIYLAREIPWEKEWGHASWESLKGKGREMMPLYDHLYSHFSDNPEFLYNYTAELFQAGYTEKAWHTVQACRQQWSKYNLELLTGDICRDLQKYEEAICHYRRASYMCPVRFAPLEGLYCAYRNTKDTVHADSIARIIQQKKIKVPSYDIERIKKEIKPINQPMVENVP